jgi:transcriptional regulator with XRE-family HTH domain
MGLKEMGAAIRDTRKGRGLSIADVAEALSLLELAPDVFSDVEAWLRAVEHGDIALSPRALGQVADAIYVGARGAPAASAEWGRLLMAPSAPLPELPLEPPAVPEPLTLAARIAHLERDVATLRADNACLRREPGTAREVLDSNAKT